jgi:predicted MFS family arabinose efflux permease
MGRARLLNPEASRYDDVVTPAPQAQDSSPLPWRILSGLAISGFLLALPGGLLPWWGYHVEPAYGTAANFFLALGAGMTTVSLMGYRYRAKLHPARVLAGGCFLGAIALLMLSLSAPPASAWFQALALLMTGAAAGAINMAVLEPIAPAYEANPAGVTLTAGMFFGAGSVVSAWLMSVCLDAANPRAIFALAALLPGLAGLAFGRAALNRWGGRILQIEEAVKDLRSVMAIMFALLLFFQFANEWSLAGWLPIFLIDRLGMNPSGAVMLLAVYWLALTAGKFAATRLLPFVPHARLLGISAFCALFGCVVLLATKTTLGVVTGILLTGAGFSAIYPLAAERISTRFTYYHPGYFNGIFTFAMLGGMLAPFVLGHLADAYGLQVVPLAAMAGSCAVFLLISMIWLGRKVSGS